MRNYILWSNEAQLLIVDLQFQYLSGFDQDYLRNVTFMECRRIAGLGCYCYRWLILISWVQIPLPGPFLNPSELLDQIELILGYCRANPPATLNVISQNFKAHQLRLFSQNPSKEPISFWILPNPQ